MSTFFQAFALFHVTALPLLYTVSASNAMLQPQEASNELCDDSSWNIIKGDWSFNTDQCLLKSTDESYNDIIWLGSADGQTPNCRYCHESFQLTLLFAVQSGDGRAGILYRAEEVSKKEYQGTYYQVRTFKDENEDKIQIGSVNGTHKTKEAFPVERMEWDIVHNLTLIARATFYDVYFDDDVVVENYNLSEYTSFNRLGIGLRTSTTNATFYSLAYTTMTSQPTPIPTVKPTDNPTIAPSMSPTRYPIQYGSFQYEIYGKFIIYNLSHSQLDLIDDDIDQFIVVLTEIIHSGMDKDNDLEFKDVVLSLSTVNRYNIEDIFNGTEEKLILSLDDGMALLYLIEFENYWKCDYVLGEEYDHSVLEKFVTEELNDHFVTSDEDRITFVVQSFNDSVSASTIALGTSSTAVVVLLHSTFYVIMGSIAFILLFLSFLIVCWGRCTKQKSRSLYVSNTLVAMVSIGDYSGGNKIEREVPGVYSNLVVEKDIETMRDLCKFMRWTFTSKGKKVHWTEKEIVSFIETEIGEMMLNSDGTLTYDGLIVVISCHGIPGHIVTSDFKAMEKTAIHRMLSLKYPMLREIPRIFVFDCCNGSDQKRERIDTRSDEPNCMEQVDLVGENKNVALDDVQILKMNTWTLSTKNPDYNLVEVHAANPQYVAKMSLEGSFLVDMLVQAIRRSVEWDMDQELAELLEEVQNTLHDAGHQQTVNILNNNTRTLVFRKNPVKK